MSSHDPRRGCLAEGAAPLDVERAVLERYVAGARGAEAEPCCQTDADPRYLAAIPREVLERDYGCGDPSRHLCPGEVVLDLGSGAGKTCFIASQIVGPRGRVIGVDFNPEMPAVAERHRRAVGDAVGWHNVEFRRGRIQDLALDLDRVDRWLAARPVRSSADLSALEAEMARLRVEEPLVADASVDAVISNCVLNLVADRDKEQLFREIFRVLRNGGRAAISDIVSDEDVPPHMKRDAALWSGCLSGALREDRFLQAFAVVYLGPWREVVDDDGQRLRRGERMAVCDKTFRLLGREPYAGQVALIEPYVDIPLEQARPFPCSGEPRRHPRETKGEDYRVATEAAGSCCSRDDSLASPGGSSCC
jgi:ubiquinone/menaquinone biosynthesis C-methylase UbiE